MWSVGLSGLWLAATMLPANRAMSQQAQDRRPAQPAAPAPGAPPPGAGDFPPFGPDGFPPGGFRPFGGPGGPGGRPGGPLMQERKVVKQFDADKNGWLNQAERQAAREFLKTNAPAAGPGRGPGGRGPGFGPPGGPGFGPPGGPGFGPGGPRGNREPAKPGARVSPSEVKTYPSSVSLYEPRALRTLFLDFENTDWEKELAEFRNTDVEVPAILTVDGKKYANVGVRFRGASSYFAVPEGYKRSLNLSVDLSDSKQRVNGVKTLNLLNSNGDPTFLRAVLYSHIARQYIPAPQVNLVKVVINGENWGLYLNAEQFNGDFVKERFGSAKGTRWKVPGNPGGGAGLAYLGEDVEAYKRAYEIKNEDGKKTSEAWDSLVELCRTLEKTPPEKLEAALAPLLDLDGVLKFLALENVFINEDGYWIRASDFSLFRDEKGKFHVIPHDMNETFHQAGGPGGPGGPRGPRRFGPGGPGGFGPAGPGAGPGNRPMGAPGAGPAQRPAPIPGQPGAGPRDVFVGPGPGGPGFGGPGGPGFGAPGGPRFGGPGFGPGAGGGLSLDPMAGANDPRKPLLSKLLAAPSLKARYLGYVRAISEQWLDWSMLRPLVAQYRMLIEREVEGDTRKLSTTEAFREGLGLDAPAPQAEAGGPRRLPNLRTFVEQRRAFLLNHAEIRKIAAR